MPSLVEQEPTATAAAAAAAAMTPAPSLVIPDKALHILVHVIETLCMDILNHHTHAIMTANDDSDNNNNNNNNERIRIWLALEFFWRQLEQAHHPYGRGRLSLLRRLARIIVATTAPRHSNHSLLTEFEFQHNVMEEEEETMEMEDPAIIPYESTVTATTTTMRERMVKLPYLPLTQWTRAHWDILEAELDDIRNQMIRRNAKEYMPFDIRNNKNNNNINNNNIDALVVDQFDPDLCEAPLFHGKLNAIFKCLDVYRVMSPFRDMLEQQLIEYEEQQKQQQSLNKSAKQQQQQQQRPQIDPTLLEAFGNEIEQQDDVQVQQALKALLETRRSSKRRGSGSSGSTSITLLRLEELHDIFQQTPPFALQHFCRKLHRLLQKWITQVFGTEEEKAHDRINDDSSSSKRNNQNSTSTTTVFDTDPVHLFAVDESQVREEDDDEEANAAVAAARQPSQQEDDDGDDDGDHPDAADPTDENTPPDFLTQDLSLVRKTFGTNVQHQEDDETEGDDGNGNDNKDLESDLDRKPAAKETKQKKTKQHLQELRAARTKLLEEGKDPLEECRELARQAVRASTTLQPQATNSAVAAGETTSVRPSPKKKTSSPAEAKKSLVAPSRKRAAQAEAMYQRNPTARRVMFESDEDEEEPMEDADDNDDDDEKVTPTSRRRRKLPDLPERARIATPRARPVVPDEPKNKDHLSGYNARQRRFFTEEEKQAIREGVRRFGKGKWARIKAEYAIILRNRTSVQIKDCYRTLSIKEEDPES